MQMFIAAIRTLTLRLGWYPLDRRRPAPSLKTRGYYRNNAATTDHATAYKILHSTTASAAEESGRLRTCMRSRRRPSALFLSLIVATPAQAFADGCEYPQQLGLAQGPIAPAPSRPSAVIASPRSGAPTPDALTAPPTCADDGAATCDPERAGVGPQAPSHPAHGQHGLMVSTDYPKVWSVSCCEEHRHRRRISILVPGGMSGGSSGPPLGLQYLHGIPGAPHSQPPSMPQGMARCASQTHFASRQNRQLGKRFADNIGLRLVGVRRLVDSDVNRTPDDGRSLVTEFAVLDQGGAAIIGVDRVGIRPGMELVAQPWCVMVSSIGILLTQQTMTSCPDAPSAHTRGAADHTWPGGCQAYFVNWPSIGPVSN